MISQHFDETLTPTSIKVFKLVYGFCLPKDVKAYISITTVNFLIVYGEMGAVIENIPALIQIPITILVGTHFYGCRNNIVFQKDWIG